MTEQTTKPDIASARKTGGGGPEPDPDQRASASEPSDRTTSGNGVDLKSSKLPETEE